MQVSEVLDVLENLLRAVEHPDITAVTRYGSDNQPGGQSPSGIKVTHQTGSTVMIWAAIEPKDAKPAPLGEMPPPRLRAYRMLTLTHQILDVARPEKFRSWEACASSGVGLVADGPAPGRTASALRIRCTDGTSAYLRFTAASGPGGSAGEPETDPYPDFAISL